MYNDFYSDYLRRHLNNEACEVVLMYGLQGERKRGVELDTILLFNIESLITKYEQKIFKSIVKKEYDTCKNKLTQFCLELIDLPDEEQIFIAKTFFVSIITDIIKVHTRKNQLHPKILASSYEIGRAHV